VFQLQDIAKKQSWQEAHEEKGRRGRNQDHLVLVRNFLSKSAIKQCIAEGGYLSVSVDRSETLGQTSGEVRPLTTAP